MSENFAANRFESWEEYHKDKEKKILLRSGGGGERGRDSAKLQWGYSPQICWWRGYPSQLLQRSKENLSHVHWSIITHFYPRPVLAFGYCHRLRLWVCVCVYQSRACPHDNSSPIQARITKFRQEMQNTLVWVPIILGDDWPWSSRSNLTWKSNFTPFWACSHHYSSAIQARITTFGPKMHLSTVKIPTNLGLDWFWSSLSFSILKPIFLPNLFAPFLYIFSETRRL